MKTISIYWRNNPEELRLLPDVRVATCGGEGMQVVGTDEAIDALVEAAQGQPEHFSYDGPHPAEDYDLATAVVLAVGNWPEFESVDDLREWLAEA